MKIKVILIVGPSGVGKDTLLRYAKEVFGEKLNFVKRYITRESDTNENNFYIDKNAFEILKDNSYFVSSWEAHGNYYGIPKKFINLGLNIISISRAKILDFENLYDNVYTINVTLPREELRKRLVKRARESKEEIESRLNRSYKRIDAKNLIEFDNSFDLKTSKSKFLELLRMIENE